MTETWITIIGMAAATYLTRVGGVWAVSRLTLTPRLERWLNQLPATVLMAIVAPLALHGGPPEWIGLLVVVVTACLSGNLLLTIGLGTIVVVLLRPFA